MFAPMRIAHASAWKLYDYQLSRRKDCLLSLRQKLELGRIVACSS